MYFFEEACDMLKTDQHFVVSSFYIKNFIVYDLLLIDFF